MRERERGRERERREREGERDRQRQRERERDKYKEGKDWRVRDRKIKQIEDKLNTAGEIIIMSIKYLR